MSFKGFLNEIFNSPVGYLVQHEDGDVGGIYKFSIDSQLYQCTISAEHGNKRNFNVSFAAFRPLSPGSSSLHRTYNAWNANGKELAVYSTVITIIVNYFKKYPLGLRNYIKFVGFQGEKQHKIYDRIAKVLSERLGLVVQTRVTTVFDKEYYLFNYGE